MSAKKPTEPETAPPRAKRVCLGAFAGAHGVRGEAKVKTFTGEPSGVAAYGPVESEDGARRFTLTFIRILKKDLALVSAPEIASREDAAALAGARLYVRRDALPPADADEFYLEDLVGLDAFDEAGAAIGKVVAVHNFGAGDIIELRRGKEARMIAFRNETVPEIDIEGGRLTIARRALDEMEPESGAS